MEGFLETSGSIYLCSFKKSFAGFVLKNCKKNCDSCNIFLFKKELQQHPIKKNPFAAALFVFSFLYTLNNVFLIGGQFRHTLKMKAKPSIETALPFFICQKKTFSYYLKSPSNAHLKEIFPFKQYPLSFLTINNFPENCDKTKK